MNVTWIAAGAAIASAIAAIFSVIVALLSRKTQKDQTVMHEEQNEWQRANDASIRFVRAIENLSSSSLPVRMAALHELKLLCPDIDDVRRKSLNSVLSHFVKERFENSPREKDEKKPHAKPEDDVFLASEFLSHLREKCPHGAEFRPLNQFGAELRGMNGEKLDLFRLRLRGAQLIDANLQGAQLEDADLRNAQLWKASLQSAQLVRTNFQDAQLMGADLRDARLMAGLQGADLRDAKNLTVEQLLEAYIAKTTQLDDHLANDPRIQARIAECAHLFAEQDQTPIT